MGVDISGVVGRSLLEVGRIEEERLKDRIDPAGMIDGGVIFRHLGFLNMVCWMEFGFGF